MWQIFTGSLLLSLIHASIPNHWIPLITIGKTENRTIKETLAATIITGFAHTLSTVIIGILIGYIGIRLSNSYSLIMNYISPSILIAIGIMYVLSDIKRYVHHQHKMPENTNEIGSSRSKAGILVSLSMAMFFTPCVEIEAYYFQAGMIGWKGIFTVSAVYTLVTIIVMVLLVLSGFKATRRLRSHVLEHHEKSITGAVLVALGIIGLFVKF